MNAWSKMSYQCGDCELRDKKSGICQITFEKVSAQKTACRSFEG